MSGEFSSPENQDDDGTFSICCSNLADVLSYFLCGSYVFGLLLYFQLSPFKCRIIAARTSNFLRVFFQDEEDQNPKTHQNEQNWHKEMIENCLTSSSQVSASDQYLPEKQDMGIFVFTD